MKIAITKEEVETMSFSCIDFGGLFTDPDKDDSPLYMKTNEGDSIDLFNGEVEDLFHPDYQVVDATDKYVIVNT